MSIYLYIHPSIYQYICLSICLYVYLYLLFKYFLTLFPHLPYFIFYPRNNSQNKTPKPKL